MTRFVNHVFYIMHTADSCYWHSVSLLYHPHKEGLELVCVFMRDIMLENENVSWQSCPKIPNSKWQHPCWLACFSIKLGYTSDEERWPTSILMTCFTCVWANECVCVRGRNGWREEVRKTQRERENVFVSRISWPLLFPKGSFGLQTLHCIIAGKGRRDSGLERILGSSLLGVLYWQEIG